VLALTYSQTPGFPRLHILDSTDPAQIRSVEQKVNLAKTLFIVSSKSGSTLEPNIYKQYFFERVQQAIGADKAGSRFIAITDPGSKMQLVAERNNFRHIFYGLPTIGGRYSALSNFGMIPAAAMGLDTQKFLQRTKEMVDACKPSTPVEKNPGVMLGLILGSAAKLGRDKITLIASPGIADVGAWLEQLIAESTGKLGKGIIPVDRETLGAPDVYGNDRIFAYLSLEGASDAAQDAKVAVLEKAGQPVIRINLADTYSLGPEFFRWEIATAVAGSILGINAFNQPDVEASKIVTKQLTSEYESKGALPAEQPIVEEAGIKLFTDEKNATELAKAATRAPAGSSSGAPGRKRLLCIACLYRNECRARISATNFAHARTRSQARSNVSRFRSTLSAFHGTSLQRRAQQRRFPADYLRRCAGLAGSRTEVHVRSCEGGAGSRRLPGSCRPQAPRSACTPRRRCKSGAHKTDRTDKTNSAIEGLPGDGPRTLPWQSRGRIKEHKCSLEWSAWGAWAPT
jgi:hypothetical protein